MKDHFSEEEARRAFAQLDQRLRDERLVPPPRFRSFRPYWVAAGVALLLLSVWAIDSWLGTSPKAVDLITKVNPPGQRTQLQLPDGTRVWLNADSQLRYPRRFSADRREVKLQGEAFFEVVRDTLRPLVIRTAAAQVRVLGTAFNVRAPASGPTEAVVVSGSIAFGAADAPRPPLVLQANERALLDPTTGHTEKSTVDVRSYTAWKDGTLIFENDSLATVLSALEKWYGVRFVVDNPAINACRITATFNDLSLATLLNQIQFVIPITYRLEGKQVYIGGPSCAPEAR
jgi:ferric-dicitrate binding protein FerR (iron transport regulator)